MKNIAVIGANFGDESKGKTVDYWVKKLQEQQQDCMVIRYSGSNNATHTVYKNSTLYHAFSSIGSGGFRNVPTYLSQYFIVDPVALARERHSLKQKFPAYDAPIYIDPRCRLVTPYDVVINRLKEHFAGEQRHGSTGNGLNECIQRQAILPFFVQDLSQSIDILRKIHAYFLKFLNQYDQIHLDTLNAELKKTVLFCLDADNIAVIAEKYEELYASHYRLTHPNLQYYSCIFEGSQGLALDQDAKHFPYVTHAKTGVANILNICQEFHVRLDQVYYLSRCYLTRHGYDPFFNQNYHHDVQQDFRIYDVTNVKNPWQGAMQYDYLNVDEMEQRITEDFQQCAAIFPNCQSSRVFSCLDQIQAEFKVHLHQKLMAFSNFQQFLQQCYPQTWQDFILHDHPCNDPEN